MTDPPLLECHGGPWDGRQIADRGPQFPVSSSVEADGTIRPLRRPLGHYIRCPDGYHWRPATT
jgi:hypothetical protein